VDVLAQDLTEREHFANGGSASPFELSSNIYASLAKFAFSFRSMKPVIFCKLSIFSGMSSSSSILKPKVSSIKSVLSASLKKI
jgi:hypothetical protein